MPVLAAAFRFGSRLRGARAFHPRGVVMQATWRPVDVPTVLAASPLLAAEHHALVRISRGIGLPVGVPDILGVAVKVIDVYGDGRDQDLLLASSGRGRIGRHLLWPGRDLATSVFSTILPYEVPDEGDRPIVARARDGSGAVTYADVLRRGPSSVPAFEVRLGTDDGPLLATVEPAGRVSLEQGEALAFDPWHTGPDLRPTGWVNRLRRPTYGASREGRRGVVATRAAGSRGRAGSE